MEITHTKDTRTSSSIKIIHPKDFPPLSTISCLIYGRRGVGKTTFALSAPNPILLNLGGRVTTTHQQDNIITISSYDRLLEVLKSGTLNNYDTIIIDTFDDLVTYVFDNWSEKDPKLKKDNGEPTITGWSAIKCNIQNFLNELFKLKLDKHLIFTAHVREYPHGVRPGSKGSCINELIKRIDLVGYMKIVNDTRLITFEPDATVIAKNCLNLKGFLDNTFFTKLIEKLHERKVEHDNLVREYEQLLLEQDDKLALVETASDLEKLISELKRSKNKVIWDSKRIYWDKIKKLAEEKFKLKYDDATEKFVASNA